MSGRRVGFHKGRIFDGKTLHAGWTAHYEDGALCYLGPSEDAPASASEIDLKGGIFSPGYMDLQVNGGGGLMFNDAPTVETLAHIAGAHRTLGVTAILPTLITDTAEKTRAAIAAACDAVAQGVRGIAGLHLEGPHLSVARKGAHDARLIRPMSEDDLQLLVEAAAALDVLKVTVAPENTTEEQVAALSRAGVLVSLGHTDADYETCRRYFAAGARCATHLFNAMSQLGSRAPGLVGAVLATEGVSAGLIADTVHVHPQSMRIAWTAKAKPGGLFLVTDAMAVAGTALDAFHLEGRLITRRDGILTLEDGTLAGADLDLTRAIQVLVEEVGVPLEDALYAATTAPAAMIGRQVGLSNLSEVICITADLSGVSWAEDAL